MMNGFLWKIRQLCHLKKLPTFLVFRKAYIYIYSCHYVEE